MSQWTLDNIPSQQGKVILITGANSGLGFNTSKVLAEKGAKVIMTARNMQKGIQAVNDIKKAVPNADLELMQLDLADLENIRQFTQTVREKYNQLDILINNAGVMAPNSRQETKQGFELQFGTNHLGHFLLTAELFDLLENASQSRIIVVSSMVAKMKTAEINWDDLHFTNNYHKWRAYEQSKFANMMFGIELDTRLKSINSNVSCIMAHPGYTATNLQNNMGLLGKVLNALIAQPVEMGILPTLRASCDANATGGDYYGPAKLGNSRGYPELNTLNPKAKNRELTQRLWKISEELTNTNFLIASMGNE